MDPVSANARAHTHTHTQTQTHKHTRKHTHARTVHSTYHIHRIGPTSAIAMLVFLVTVILAVAPAAVVGYPEGAPSESCYLMYVNHTDNFDRPRPSRDCGPDCDHSLEIAGAVVSDSNRTRIEGNGSVTTYECGTVYESKCGWNIIEDVEHENH